MADKFARALRSNLTIAELVVWANLREFRRRGLHFRRQVPIGRYVVDFACHSAKLIVELDGEQHGTIEARKYDEARTRFLNGEGYRVIRFANWEVMTDRERVLEAIWHHASKKDH
ncbi:MAG TPA: DUF559 domain-containing protein [Rhizomicrobium sp.]|nr:DUF559 domain-containing protein [Rhizomicrobium sp.]